MPTTTVQEPQLAVLKWQLIEQMPGDGWVVAAFDLEIDAEAARDALATVHPGREYTVRQDPRWADGHGAMYVPREIRRDPESIPAHERIEP